MHLCYLAFIPLGGFIAWRWPRVILAHVAAVAIGVVSITVGFDCPLTTWEQSLRRRGGQRPYTDGFVDHYLTGRVYPHGYEWAVQVIFGVCIVGSYVYVVRRARRTAVPKLISPKRHDRCDWQRHEVLAYSVHARTRGVRDCTHPLRVSSGRNDPRRPTHARRRCRSPRAVVRGECSSAAMPVMNRLGQDGHRKLRSP